MRKEDQEDRIYFRTNDRFAWIDGKWWFTTRDGDHGPYATRERAEHELRRFLAGVDMLEKHKDEVERARKPTQRGDPTIWNKLGN